MPEPDVTIVITTRNRPDLVQRAVGSALAQTIRAIEVIVVDDASTEPVRLAKADARLRVLHTRRWGGVCAARNLGLASARGRWVTFLDDDDELFPDMLERSLKAVRTSTLPRPVAALSAIEEVDETGRVIRTRLPASLVRSGLNALGAGPPGPPEAHATLVVPTDVARAIGGWDEALRAWEHIDFYLRLNAACSIQGIEQVTYRRRVHQARLTENLPARIDGIQRTLAKHQAVFDQHPRRHAHYLGAVGLAWLRLGQWRPAVAASTQALRLSPWRAKGVAQLLVSLAGPRVWALVDPRSR